MVSTRRISIVLALSLVFTAAGRGQSITIGYTNCLAVTNYSASLMAQIGEARWYFAHASVGTLMMEGVTNLNAANTNFYPLQARFVTNFPPAALSNGFIYQDPRGDIATTDGSYTGDWAWKISYFQVAVSNGWHYPAVNYVIDKPCYIDIWHLPNLAGVTNILYAYLGSMTNLEAAFPQTVFVYCTMPLVTTSYFNANETQPLSLFFRNVFNNNLRAWCAANNRVLFDLADIEAHDTNGNIVTFTYSNLVCQQLFGGYNSSTNYNPVWKTLGEWNDGAHPVDYGAEKMLARGFYALTAALLPSPSSITVTSSANPSAYGKPVSFLATVTGSNSVPTGAVQFQTNGVNFGPALALSGGLATNSSVGSFQPGNLQISASYSGDRSFNASTGSLVQSVLQWSGAVQFTGMTGGTAIVLCAGTPGLGYALLRSSNLAGPWVTLLTTNAPAGGLFRWSDDFHDLAAAPHSAFYQLQQP